MVTSDKIINQYLLTIDGVNQLERSAVPLDATGVRMDGRSKQDILRFLYALSEQIRFYDLNNLPQGNWQPFLDILGPGGAVPNETQLTKLLATREDWPAHITLLMSFLHLFTYAQADLNKLPLKRLNFYYEDVLKLARRAALTDQVHVIFELAKNAIPTLLKTGTILKGGTTADGLPLNYALESDYVISHSKIAKMLSSYADKNNSGQQILFKAEDPTVLKSTGISWRPFGVAQLNKTDVVEPMQPATVGFAIASPNFFLAEGNRIITLTFKLKSTTQATQLVLISTLDIKLTTADGWVSPDAILKAELTPSPLDLPTQKEFNTTLEIELQLDESAPAIVAYNSKVHQPLFETTSPAITINLRPESYLIETLGNFTVEELKIDLDVKNVKNLVLQNDQSVQAMGSPALPFTSFPRIGSNFYVGSEEAFKKSLTSIAVTLEWQDPPPGFGSYYEGYDNTSINNLTFQTHIYFLSGKSWIKLSDDKYPLFDNNDPATPKKLLVDETIFPVKLAGSDFKRQPGTAAPTSFDPLVQQGFIKLVLVSPTRGDVGNAPTDAPFEAFGHKSFPIVYARKAIDKGLGVPDIVLPQQPYTPTLTSVSLDYTATDTLILSAPNYIDQFFLLDIFGGVESDKVDVVKLIPDHPQQGALYLGLEKAAPSQLLSLLVQLEEGSTPSPELLKSEDIIWSYLANGEWRNISTSDIREDKTDGFQISGLIRLLIGADATQTHTRMPPGFHWLRASVKTNADGAAGIQALYTQAARASLVIGEGLETKYDTHLQNPLPAETISSMEKKLAAIKKVTQPYSSFGGRPSESDQSYHQRAHERLRHRDRAVTAWDHERLLLETFPSIFKVKCLPHTNISNELAPGNVKLVIVPDWRKRSTGNPLMPKANGAFLRTLEEFIESTHSSAFSNVTVTNPVYETLLVDSKIIFKPDFDPGYYSVVLEDEIKRFLSPWAYEEGEDIVFDGKISASEILAFIEGREYVDHVTDFELYHRHKGKAAGGIGEMQIDIDFIIGITPDPTIGPDGVGKTIGLDFVIGVPVETAASTTPDAILVSNDHHRIGVLSADGKICEGIQEIGIGEMIIGLDFIIVT